MDLRPIIVGVDRGEGRRDALALARVLAEITGSPLEVISVRPFAPLSSRISGASWEDTTADDTDAALTLARAELAGVPGVTMRGLPAGTPVLGLDLAAEQADARLIVLGSTRRGRLGRVLPGSTALQLLVHSPCPVAIAPRGYAEWADTPRTIGVAFDGSDEAESALRWGADLAAAAGASVAVVGAFDETTDLSSRCAPLYGIPAYVADTRARALERLDAAAARIPMAAAELLDGRPAGCLARASESVDLMVVGTHRRGGARRLLLGSISSDLVEHAACPVVVVPGSARHSRRYD